jgi:hypothetical protein
MLLSVSSLVRMRSFEPWKEEVVILGHGNGPGAGSGPWCHFRQESKEMVSYCWIHLDGLL